MLQRYSTYDGIPSYESLLVATELHVFVMEVFDVQLCVPACICVYLGIYGKQGVKQL